MNRCKNLYEHLGISLFDSDYLEPGKNNDVKKHLGEQHVLYMLNRTQVMFDYKNLPETIPARNLEMMLQLNGNVFFTKVYGDFYVFTGGLGGEPDVYYEPTIYTVANPYLNYSKNLVIGDDGILIRNDSYGVGLLPLFKKYAALLAENELTMRIADVNNRIMFLLSAADDRTKASAEKFMDDVSKGKLDVISDNAFLESLKVLPAATQNSVRLTDLIEFEQYLRAGWFNDLGINANYNMKRESISPNEAQLNDDALLPFVDDMLEMRRIGIKQVNEKYELDIEVNLSSSWLKEQLEQVTPGVDFDSDNDEHINEDVSDIEEVTDPETAAPVQEEIPEEVPEDTTEEEPETETNQIEEDIEEIKEDIQDIKEELQDPEEDPEEGEEDE
jgi:hypothetical protein